MPRTSLRNGQVDSSTVLSWANTLLAYPGEKSTTTPPISSRSARGPLRILLVDDDYSDNNHQPGDPRESPSDAVFRRLAANAVGGDAESWSIETVKAYASGPGIDRRHPAGSGP